jgi:regulator of replication initiation timing
MNNLSHSSCRKRQRVSEQQVENLENQIDQMCDEREELSRSMRRMLQLNSRVSKEGEHIRAHLQAFEWAQERRREETQPEYLEAMILLRDIIQTLGLTLRPCDIENVTNIRHAVMPQITAMIEKTS